MTFDPDAQMETGPLRDTLESFKRITMHSIGIQHRDVQLTDAQIKALRATPVELAPGPGAGSFIMVHRMLVLANCRGTAYTVGVGTGTLDIYLADGLDESWSLFSPPVGLLTTNNRLQIWDSYFAGLASVDFSTRDGIVEFPFDGSRLIISNKGTVEYTGGDPSGTLSIRVWYSIVPAMPFGESV